jgi:hypothetical protein
MSDMVKDTLFAGYIKTGGMFTVDMVENEYGFKRYRFDRPNKTPFHSMNIDDIKEYVKKELHIAL